MVKKKNLKKDFKHGKIKKNLFLRFKQKMAKYLYARYKILKNKKAGRKINAKAK